MENRKTQVLVVSRDTVFARMLALELIASGVTARSVEIGNAFKDEIMPIVVVADSEAAGCDGVLAPQIEFGFGDAPRFALAQYFRRPFRVDELVFLCKDMVASLLANGTKDTSDGYLKSGVITKKAVKTEKREAQIGLRLDEVSGQFSYNGEAVNLTETERALLTVLYRERGETVTRERLLAEVWGRDENGAEPKTNLTDVYIRYLREKLDDRYGVRLIFNVRGKGYMLRG